MRTTPYRPLALALACLLAPCAQAWADSIPLDIIQENFGPQYAYRLGINVGVNGAAPKEYLFDTGSDSFNIDVGLTALHGSGPAWFPTQPGTATGPLQFYLYGDGTYGYLQSSTTVASLQFYDSATGARVAGYATAAGAPVAINYAYVTTTATGPVVGTFPDGTTLKIDEDFQNNLAHGVAPEEGAFYGIFGAGDFGNGVPGMLSRSGYIVEANGTGKAPGHCAAACLIENLTPELRAQFLTAVPWIGGAQGTFALSGAHSASQFDTEFNYLISQGGQTLWSATYPTLFDTGTPDIMLIDNDDGFPPGSALNPGFTLTATGNVPGAQPSSIVSGDPSSGDYSNVVGIGPYGGFPDGAIYGISFFFHNAVMYDLENQVTAYTPFFVTEAPITTSLDVTPAMGLLGLAGAISGHGSLTVEAGGVANLSAANSYTGATRVAAHGWLGLAGPGSIAQSSNVQVDGVLDISRTDHTSAVRSLSGNGTVRLGDATLDLTDAHGSFAGSLTDGGLGGGTGGRLIVSGGRETLTGDNGFTGPTGIGAAGRLDLAGALTGNAVNLGVLVDDGLIRGSVLDGGLLLGQGRIGGALQVDGVVAPGQPGAAAFQTLTVGGDFTQAAGSSYLARVDLGRPGVSSRIAVGGHASLLDGARLDVVATPGTLYRTGSRYTVLSAAQGVTGTYALAADMAISPVLGLAAAYDADHVYLDVVQSRPLPALAGTPNQAAALGGAQSLAPAGELFTRLANLPSDAAIRGAADQLSGEIHASVQSAYLLDSRYLRDAMDARLDGDADAAGQVVQAGPGGRAWWGQFVSGWGHHDSDGNAAGIRDNTAGFYVGHDVALGHDSRLGVLAGFTHSAVKADARGSSATGNDLHLGAYAGTRFGRFGLRGGLAYTRHALDTSRIVALPGLADHAQGDYRARVVQGFAEAGYRLDFRHSMLEPFAQAAYVKLSTDSFAEHGGIEALHGRGDDHGTTFTTLGARAATWFVAGGGHVALHGMLGWRHASGYVDPRTTLAFAGGSPFDVASAPIAHDALALQVGLGVQASPSTSLDFSYQGQVSRHAVDGGFHFGFDWKF
ncbi:autotransporter domain-containing protein [Fulvimonas sp. R45]|uniref:autotransporter outer membrane beta-barrel domain-containing protein n=1 Tax=Fulvimonas sp. R45 TaxID=3045937 RepID=UPI00265F6764|nr:autotransporter domain-containing protein [Fulvimonas sp. R45]MDO1527919.1 autotransporter domain-containing protein [Fulvimonas sp. R45]